ncbi:MAG: ATP-binding cassette domain-containing protein [Spirochaetia bacterium]|jgi:signal transduction histidine kinase/ABC-type branched-subunit amino acid transport system ATPase component
MESPQAPAAPELTLALEGVSRDYGSLAAVRDVSLALHRGEIHALVGQHGAGKTTLAMIVSGMLRPKSGAIVFGGRRYQAMNVQLTHRLGIKMVYQQLLLNDNFTVAENLFSHDRSVNSFSWNSLRKVNRATEELFEKYSFTISPVAKLRSLSLSDRAVVDILKQLTTSPRLLILDEALEKLTPPALARIVPILLERVRAGLAVLFITHRIDDVYTFAHKVSIIRDGQLIFTGRTDDIDKLNLVRMAYTHFSAESDARSPRAEFTRFLRYNEAILQHLPISLMVTDAEHRVKLANEYCKAAFSLDGDDFRDRPVMDLLSSLGAEEAGSLQAALGSEEDREFFNVSLRVDQRVTLNNIKTLPVYDEGAHIGTILVIEDITQYDKLQKKVILTEKLASVGLLAAGVAHEINNPLEIIYNYISVLRKRVRGEDTRSAVNKLSEEISYIASIVSNLVNLADGSRGGSEEINLNVVVGKILELLVQSARSRNIEITFVPGGPDVPAFAKAQEVKQVILNLMKNSFEAMPRGGRITVTTGTSTTDAAASAVVIVEDEGPGISAANLDDVFLPFYTTKKAGGANIGLGLSVSYAIIERSGGKLRAENLPGGGCRFTMALPQRRVDGEAIGVGEQC